MDQAREKLTQASHKLAEQMYKAAQPTPALRAQAQARMREQLAGGDGQPREG